MSLADTRRVKDLEEVVRLLEERVLMLEMQKRPVEAVAQLIDSNALASAPLPSFRKTLTLRGKAA